MAIRAVLFDWDGTLVDNPGGGPSWPLGAVAAHARHSLHLALRDEALESAFTASLPPYEPGVTRESPRIGDLLRATFARLGWLLDGSDIDECARLLFEELTLAQMLFDDVRPMLASLKYRGYRLAAVTNSLFPGSYQLGWLVGQGLAGYLDACISSADAGKSKPDVAPFLAALSALAIESHEALFVGDRVETDIAGALKAGMRAVLIDRSGQRKEGAGYLVIRHLSGLNDILGEGISPAASAEGGFGIIERGS
jgi:HAD superfamily hydrolase (TIGR01549 family)